MLLWIQIRRDGDTEQAHVIAGCDDFVSERQTVPDRGVVRSCDTLTKFWGSDHITGTDEPKVGRILYTGRLYQF